MSVLLTPGRRRLLLAGRVSGGPDDLAAAMWDECVSAGQSARRVPAGGGAEAVRAALRRIAREFGVHVRTAVLDDDVLVVARTDAALWTTTPPRCDASSRPRPARPVVVSPS